MGMTECDIWLTAQDMHVRGWLLCSRLAHEWASPWRVVVVHRLSSNTPGRF